MRSYIQYIIYLLETSHTVIFAITITWFFEIQAPSSKCISSEGGPGNFSRILRNNLEDHTNRLTWSYFQISGFGECWNFWKNQNSKNGAKNDQKVDKKTVFWAWKLKKDLYSKSAFVNRFESLLRSYGRNLDQSG